MGGEEKDIHFVYHFTIINIAHPMRKHIPPNGVIYPNAVIDVIARRYSENENNIIPARKNIAAFPKP